MNKLLLGSCGAIALSIGLMFSQATIAADQVYVDPAPEAAPSYYDWSGLYIGGHAGAVISDYSGFYDTADVVGPANLNNLDNTGFLGGIHAGYNFMSGHWVFGVEGDVSLAAADEAFLGPEPAPRGPDPVSIELEYLASIRGRVGYAYDRTFVYATGGVGFAGTELTITETLTGVTGVASYDHTGWVAGLGGAYAFSQRWIARAEWLYYGFNDSSPIPAATFTDADAADVYTLDNINVIRVGLSYKF